MTAPVPDESLSLHAVPAAVSDVTGPGLSRGAAAHLFIDDGALRQRILETLTAVGVDCLTLFHPEESLTSASADLAGCVIIDQFDWESVRHGLRAALATNNLMPVVLLMPSGDVRSAVRAVKCGVFDVVEKPFGGQDLVSTVLAAFVHDESMRSARQQRDSVARRMDRLTPREEEVLRYLVSGQSVKQVAAILQLSPKTVQIHRSNVLTKMQVESVTQLVRLAHTHSLLPFSSDQRADRSPVDSPELKVRAEHA